MTLRELFDGKTDTRFVAYRPGKLYYIPLGFKTLAKAIVEVADEQGLTAAELDASDWQRGEIVPYEEETEVTKQAIVLAKTEVERSAIPKRSGKVERFIAR